LPLRGTTHSRTGCPWISELWPGDARRQAGAGRGGAARCRPGQPQTPRSSRGGDRGYRQRPAGPAGPPRRLSEPLPLAGFLERFGDRPSESVQNHRERVWRQRSQGIPSRGHGHGAVASGRASARDLLSGDVGGEHDGQREAGTHHRDYARPGCKPRAKLPRLTYSREEPPLLVAGGGA
jgi:hypothetical protein